MSQNLSIVDSENNRIEYLDQRWYKIDADFLLRYGFSADQVAAILEKTGGVPMPATTMVLGDVLAKGDEFDKWLMANGFSAEEVGQRAMASGTKLHKAFELAILGNTVSANSMLLGETTFTEKEWDKFLNWQNWYENLKPVPLYLEKRVFSTNWGCAGTADWIGFIGGDLWLLDWKTGNSIYDSSDLQIAAYKKMYNEQAEILGMPLISKAGIVHVGATNKTERGMNNKGVSVKEVPETEEAVFDSIVKIWKWRNPSPKIPTHNYPVTVKLSNGVLNFNEEELANGK